MPELPEVETVRRQLEKVTLNKVIESVQVFEPKITRKDKDFARFLVGLSFTKIDRSGKLLVFNTTDPEINLLAHLKMTGKFLLREGVESENEYDKHTHLVFNFNDGLALLFNDVRKFGYVVRADSNEVERVRARFGIEPLTSSFTLDNFEKIFPRRKTNIKSLLLNQSLVAGLGNIYVDEVLFRAGVLPTRPAHSISDEEKKKIFSSTEEVLRTAIEKGGTTFIDFAHTDGAEGSYVDELQVFSRASKPCFRCAGAIEKARVAGRGTHFCPSCQR